MLTATTQAIAWSAIFFFASSAASSAYLTVSEIFPLEIRGLAIAIFYAFGTLVGGVAAPSIFGLLIQSESRTHLLYGYLAGAALMIGAAVVEAFLEWMLSGNRWKSITDPLSRAKPERIALVDLTTIALPRVDPQHTPCYVIRFGPRAGFPHGAPSRSALHIHATKVSRMPVFKFKGVDFIEFDALLSEEERLVRDTSRRFIEENLVPIIEQCNRDGRFPRELVKPMADLGFFGANLKGYGCAGMSNVEYGLVMQEMERGEAAYARL